MALLRTLITSVVAKTSSFEAGMARSTKSVDRFKSGTNRMQQAFRGFAALFAGFSMARFIRETVNTADELQHFANRLGASANEVQKLIFIADRSGITFQQMSTSLQRLTRRIGEAGMGTGEALKVFTELRLDVQKLMEMGLAEQFITVAKALSEVENNSKKVALTAKLVDSEGVKVLQTVSQGAKGLDELNKKYDSFVQVSQDSIDALQRQKDRWTDFKTNLSNLSTEVLGKAIIGFEKLNKELREANKIIFEGTRKPRLSPLMEEIKGFLKAKSEEKKFMNEVKDFLKSRNSGMQRNTEFLDFSDFPRGGLQPLSKLEKPLEPMSRVPKVVEEVAMQTNKLQQVSDGMAESFVSAFAAITSGANDAKAAIRQMAMEIIQLTARQTIQQPLANMLSQGLQAGFGALFNIGGGGPGSAVNPTSTQQGIDLNNFLNPASPIT